MKGSAAEALQGDLFGIPENPQLHLVQDKPKTIRKAEKLKAELASNGLPLSTEKFGFAPIKERRDVKRKVVEAKKEAEAEHGPDATPVGQSAEGVEEAPAVRPKAEIQPPVVGEAGTDDGADHSPSENHALSIPAFAALGVIAFVGVGCLVRSAINTTTFLSLSGQGSGLSAFTGIMLALYSAVAFSLGLVAVKMKIWAGALCIPVAAFVVLFSVFSSVSVAYTQMQKATVSAKMSVDYLAETERLKALNDKESEIVGADIERLTAESEYWKSKSWAKHEEAERELTIARQRRGGLLQERRTLEGRGVKSVEAQGNTSYAFLAKMFGVSEDGVRMWAMSVPAVFYDVVSPLVLSLVIAFLRRRKG
jgi:ABC-type multidrug transport system fused ATPase/permease subunit